MMSEGRSRHLLSSDTTTTHHPRDADAHAHAHPDAHHHRSSPHKSKSLPLTPSPTNNKKKKPQLLHTNTINAPLVSKETRWNAAQDAAQTGQYTRLKEHVSS